ncbi:Endonuclease/Exonuclease/phosphatase family protein [Planctomycetes bacterium K2D]|uniref:Endonuclease/Exonuclease/phosphatase family protein n=2 Tax=Botrimarina mediterranea TaxID=2528022 RepID=A0A518K334_9BACT|nr:Endonuclease/Exonuclease/phosphatase family protein [Botrimarina mediterranea]QDV76762.1 Endonuclease/Exonuclease/phosphatase family protein [Planctomycetes bacterium K2D]
MTSTGTFIDRHRPDDLRVVSYNVYFNSALFSNNGADPTTPSRFQRLVKAMDPDILALQEMSPGTAEEVATLLNGLIPLPGSAGWQTHQVSDNVIASRHPFLLTTGSVGHADALIDLPDDRHASDIYVMNDHWPCCTNEIGRQREADRMVRWIDGLRSPDGLATETPFVVVGDLNTVGSGQPLRTLLTGDIVDASLGADSPPDWDGTPLSNATPLHNGVGPDRYTWRNDSDVFDPGVLDHIIYTDSVLETANRFVLNTMAMNEVELLATSLEAEDVMITTSQGFYDHLPLVVDFRERPLSMVGDFNRDGFVDEADYDTWRLQFNAVSAPPADGNGDGVVNAADYTVWRDAHSASLMASALPEPCSLSLVAIALVVCPTGDRRFRARDEA